MSSPYASSAHPIAASFLPRLSKPALEVSGSRGGKRKSKQQGGPGRFLLWWHLGPLLALDSSPVSILQHPRLVSAQLQ